MEGAHACHASDFFKLIISYSTVVQCAAVLEEAEVVIIHSFFIATTKRILHERFQEDHR